MTTVFVVDDEHEMVDLIALGLKKRGFTIVPFGERRRCAGRDCPSTTSTSSSPIST